LIVAESLTKRYGPVLALDRLNLTVPDGAVLGLLGPNGSGKSTLAGLIMGFIFPNGGRLDLGRWSPAQIGFMPERPCFPPRVRARDYMMLTGRLGGLGAAGLKQAAEMRLDQMGLGQAASWPIGSYSKGMLQRLALANALLAEPPVLIMDEPMSGLDPLWQKAVRELVWSLHRSGITVLLSTHRLEDISDLCTHVAIVNHGRLVRGGSLAEVLAPRNAISIRTSASAVDMAEALKTLGPGVTASGNTVTLSGAAMEASSAALRLILEAGAEVLDLRRERQSLEEVYVRAIMGTEDGSGPGVGAR